jgi:hypothetical protein
MRSREGRRSFCRFAGAGTVDFAFFILREWCGVGKPLESVSWSHMGPIREPNSSETDQFNGMQKYSSVNLQLLIVCAIK